VEIYDRQVDISSHRRREGGRGGKVSRAVRRNEGKEVSVRFEVLFLYSQQYRHESPL
jgi:hypothetical protein